MDAGMLEAFPRDLGVAATRASDGLSAATHPSSDRLIQDSYERRWGRIVVAGEELKIPYRHYQDPTAVAADPVTELVRQAWLSRSWNGHVRQQAIRALLAAPASWHVPFVVQLCGEYVVDIGRDVVGYVVGSLHHDLTMVDAYRQFWSNNPEFVSLTRARAASYWDAYYRGTSSLSDYPPHAAIVGIERLVEG